MNITITNKGKWLKVEGISILDLGDAIQLWQKSSEERKDDKADTKSASAQSTVKRATTLGAVDATRKSSEEHDEECHCQECDPLRLKDYVDR